MSHLSFLVWTLTFPLVFAATGLIDAYRSKLRGFKPPSDDAILIASVLEFCIWLTVAILLW